MVMRANKLGLPDLQTTSPTSAMAPVFPLAPIVIHKVTPRFRVQVALGENCTIGHLFHLITRAQTLPMLRVLIRLAAVISSAAILAVASSFVFDRRLAEWEALCVLVGTGIVAMVWEIVQRKKERRRLRGMRDSVLW